MSYLHWIDSSYNYFPAEGLAKSHADTATTPNTTNPDAHTRMPTCTPNTNTHQPHPQLPTSILWCVSTLEWPTVPCRHPPLQHHSWHPCCSPSLQWLPCYCTLTHQHKQILMPSSPILSHLTGYEQHLLFNNCHVIVCLQHTWMPMTRHLPHQCPPTPDLEWLPHHCEPTASPSIHMDTHVQSPLHNSALSPSIMTTTTTTLTPAMGAGCDDHPLASKVNTYREDATYWEI